MTREEQLARAIAERDMLEQQIDMDNEEVKDLVNLGFTEDDDEIQDLYQEITTAENEVLYLNRVIEDLEDDGA